MARRTKKGDKARLKILKAIHEYAEEHQRPITYKELTDATSIMSTSTIYRHIAILREMGHLQQQNRGEPRSLILTHAGLEAVRTDQLSL